MIAKTYSTSLINGKTRLVGVHCEIVDGFNAFNIVGPPLSVASAIANRIRAVLYSMGLSLPAKTIMIKISIPHWRLATENIHFDLPIAVSILSAMKVIPKDEAERCVCIGPLSDGGDLGQISGTLPAAIVASKGALKLICPYDSGAEAAWVGAIQVIAPKSLFELVNHFNGRIVLSPVELNKNQKIDPRMSDLETADGRKFLTVYGTKCLVMDGQIYPIHPNNYELF